MVGLGKQLSHTYLWPETPHVYFVGPGPTREKSRELVSNLFYHRGGSSVKGHGAREENIIKLRTTEYMLVVKHPG